MKSKFITIEGCEGCGKSTQIQLLKEYFEKNSIPVVVTREPGGVPLAEKIRPLILDKSDTSVDPLAELMLFASARAQHVSEFIKPALKSGKTVICDRFTDSTLAYQGYARGISKRIIKTLNHIALDGLKVELTILLDLPPKLAFERKKGFDVNDRMESETLKFHQKVYKGYKAIAAKEPDRMRTVDASGGIKEVFERILELIK